MALRGIKPFNGPGIWLGLVFFVMFVASCASYDCAWDIKGLPDPISISADEGAIWGRNYTACFLVNGVIYKEYIPECAYKYYYDKQARLDTLR